MADIDGEVLEEEQGVGEEILVEGVYLVADVGGTLVFVLGGDAL